MAIITTTTIAITAKAIFISFGLAGFFTTSIVNYPPTIRSNYILNCFPLSDLALNKTEYNSCGYSVNTH